MNEETIDEEIKGRMNPKNIPLNRVSQAPKGVDLPVGKHTYQVVDSEEMTIVNTIKKEGKYKGKLMVNLLGVATSEDGTEHNLTEVTEAPSGWLMGGLLCNETSLLKSVTPGMDNLKFEVIERVKDGRPNRSVIWDLSSNTSTSNTSTSNKEIDKMNVEELKTLLSENGINFRSNASKDTLLALAENIELQA